MATIINHSLFSWNDVEAHSDLDRFYLVRDNLPDEKIVMELEDWRGKGRDDCPVRAMWNAIIAGVVFQHESIESLIRELSRNPALLEACGFDILPRHKKPVAELKRNEETGQMEIVRSESEDTYFYVPDSWNFSRFLKNVIELEENQCMITDMIQQLREALIEALPDFGRHLGYDGKSINSYSTGHKNRDTGETSDIDADWGKHETTGIDSKTGKPWAKIKSWFGYSLHLIADTQYEIPVAIHITPASGSEQTELRSMIKETFEETPQLGERCYDFTADRGLDSGKTKALLLDEYSIRPVIDTRELWREEKSEPGYDPEKPITRPLYSERVDTIVYTEKGTVHCICPATGEQRDMAFCGFEADRNTLKYRCPAAVYGFECQGCGECSALGNVNSGGYGRVVRINITKENRRIFTPVPHGSPSWNRAYNRRSSLERINSRLDNDFGFEKHYIRGKAKMQTRVGLATAVMMAMALGHVRAGRIKQMRSLVRPVALAA
ncbi:MAG: transposase [Deltaproteobacteria bacterium]|nr:transposase [Deltaproteobacteria bacterium]